VAVIGLADQDRVIKARYHHLPLLLCQEPGLFDVVEDHLEQLRPTFLSFEF